MYGETTTATLLTNTVPGSMLSTIVVCAVLLAAAAMYASITPARKESGAQ